jgi:hypothetical protein
MSTFVDGLRVPTTIFEAAVWQHTIKVRCIKCPNFAVFEPAGLWWWFERRQIWHGLRDAHKVFYCYACTQAAHRKAKVGARPLELVKEEPNRFLPQPDDREWKRAMSRFKT